MRKHHKKWNVVQSGHCTVVLLHLAAATGKQRHRTVTEGLRVSHTQEKTSLCAMSHLAIPRRKLEGKIRIGEIKLLKLFARMDEMKLEWRLTTVSVHSNYLSGSRRTKRTVPNSGRPGNFSSKAAPILCTYGL